MYERPNAQEVIPMISLRQLGRHTGGWMDTLEKRQMDGQAKGWDGRADGQDAVSSQKFESKLTR
jgi:hypothetical protein